MEELIRKVINGEERSVEIPRTEVGPLRDLIAKELGCNCHDVEYETNGYQCDFWLNFSGEYTLSGDLWYMTHFTFSKGEE